MTLEIIQEELSRNSTEKARKSIAKFVPNSERIYGVPMPVLNGLARNYQEGGFLLIRQLWASGAFEERMLAVKLMTRNCKKDPQLSLKLVDLYKDDINNWALCDTLASEGIRPLIKTKGSEIYTMAVSYLNNEKLWIRRLGIVMLIHFAKIKAHKEEVRQAIQGLENDKEYYIKKAMLWINRYLDKD